MQVDVVVLLAGFVVLLCDDVLGKSDLGEKRVTECYGTGDGILWETDWAGEGEAHLLGVKAESVGLPLRHRGGPAVSAVGL